MAFEDERKFLHDVANPLSIAHANLRIVLRKMNGMRELDPLLQDVVDRLQKAMEACEKMAKQLGDRHQAITNKQGETAS